ncbi:MAG: hypothetical protein R3D78_11805 [Paracoccaceae bacterium]
MIKTLNKLRNCFTDESGAVTVDWVVLTAAIVSLGFLVGGVIWSEADNAALDVARFLSSQSVTTSF